MRYFFYLLYLIPAAMVFFDLQDYRHRWSFTAYILLLIFVGILAPLLSVLASPESKKMLWPFWITLGAVSLALCLLDILRI
jgi:cytochrome bd-type quinol oxidase subunit 2